MTSVERHYATHLGPVYSWMTGGIDAALLRGCAELDALAPEIDPAGSAAGGMAVDLGAGFGMHAIPLARRGYSVLAVDANDDLLRELKARSADLPLRIVRDDLLRFRAHLTVQPAAILCMGDTLAHLADEAEVESLVAAAAAALDRAGVFVLSFRDYSTALSGAARCIPVRSDADRILTCFLEYEDTHVVVNDLLHERDGAQWTLRASSYRKFRLVPQRVTDLLERHGFAVRREAGLAGMVRLVARLRGVKHG